MSIAFDYKDDTMDPEAQPPCDVTVAPGDIGAT
jgi:hypothetical protein